MSMDRFQELTSRIEKVQQDVLIIKSRQQERAKRLEELKEQCRKAGFNPDNLKEELAKLTKQECKLSEDLTDKLEKLEAEIEKHG